MFKKIASTLVFVSSLCLGNAQATVVPVGPQVGLTLSSILSDGWTQCYSGTMAASIGNNAQNVLNGCNGDYLMMAGRVTGSDTFLIAAAALRSDTIIDTGHSSTTHIANGANWWYSPNWSWGFTSLNDTVINSQCDVSSSPTSMCLHTISGVGGYRIDNIMGLNGSTDYEKVFFVASSSQNVPEPASIALFGMALVALVASRRRRI